MVSTDPSVNHQLETEEDDDDARDAVHQAWLDVLGIDVPANIETPLQNLLVECGEPAVIHGIHASPQSGSRSFKFIAACARNYVPVPAESAAGNRYHVDLPPSPPVTNPRPLASLPPPLLRDDPLTVILSDLQRELPHDSPAHNWLKGSTLVPVADVAGIPLYHLCITDASGVSWLSNRLAVDIRKKLSVLLRQRVLVEIVCMAATS
jgi:hypothetical protein